MAIVCLIATSSLQKQISTITSFTPGNGGIGTSVTISGTNFSATAADNLVFLVQ